MADRITQYTITLPGDSFSFKTMEDGNATFSFPDDCPYAGRYFYVLQSTVQQSNDGYCVTDQLDHEVALINPRDHTFKMITWEILCLQIEIYKRENKEKLKNEKN